MFSSEEITLINKRWGLIKMGPEIVPRIKTGQGLERGFNSKDNNS